MKKHHFIIIFLLLIFCGANFAFAETDQEQRMEELLAQQKRIGEMRSTVNLLFTLSKESDKREAVEDVLNELLSRIDGVQERIKNRIDKIEEERTKSKITEERIGYDLEPEHEPETKNPPEFEISNLALTPVEAEPGQSVNISVNVKNIGELSGTKEVSFNVNDKTTTKSVTLGSEESKTVSLSVTKKSEGTYNVTVNGLSQSFKVIVTQPVAPERGSGTEKDPYIITNVQELQGMNYNLGAHYVLGNNIDAFNTKYWNDGKGFMPIGDVINKFEEVFDGQGHTIANLYVNRKESYQGLFGAVGREGVVKNIKLENVDVASYDYVGALVGANYGTVSNSHSAGSVRGAMAIGGLVGFNIETVIDSSSSVSVRGNTRVGGLVGDNLNVVSGSVSGSHSTGSVDGHRWIGGLVGENRGIISDSYSTGDVTGLIQVGGLAGRNKKKVFNSYSTGSVRGDNYHAGGLAGINQGTLAESYSTSDVSGNEYVGGLVGINPYAGTISNSYSIGSVGGTKYIGGLVGYISGAGVKISNSYSASPVKGDWWTGGLVGDRYSDESLVSNSFWDIKASRAETSNGGIGKTTAEMQSLTTFSDANWNIVLIENYRDETWYIDENKDYPKLDNL